VVEVGDAEEVSDECRRSIEECAPAARNAIDAT
jgi:hypothetical protein